MELNIPMFKRDAKGNLVNANGLTMKECDAILAIKDKNGVIPQSSNKGYENSGMTRDDYDAARRGNSKKAESESSAAYLPLPGNNESGIPGEVELRNPNGAKPGPGVSSETLTVPVSKNKYYSLPDLYFTDEAKENEKSLDASKSGLSSAVNLRNAYDSAMSSVLTKIQEKSVLLTEYEKQLGTYKPIFDSADELTRKNNSLVEEYDKLAEQRNKELGALHDDIDRVYALYEKTPTDELYSQYSDSVNKYNSLLEQTQTELSGYEKQIGDVMAQYDATVGKTADYNKIFWEYSTLKTEYDKLVEKYDGYAAEFGDVLKNYDTKLAEYKAQSNKLVSYYENEYKKWRATVRSSEIVKAEADALDKAIEELRKEISREFNPIEFIKKQANPNWSKPLKEKLAALESKRDLTYAELSAAEDIEKAEYYASFTERKDFAEGSAYVNTKGKGKPHDYSAPDASSMTIEETLNTVYGDVKYDYINGDEEAKAHVLSFGTPDPFEEYGYMKDEEIAIYNYIYRTEGKERAEAFLSDLMEDLTYRQMTKETGDYKAYADKHPVLGSLLSILTNTMKPIAAIGQLGDYILDGKIDTNASYNRASYLTSALREGASKDMNAVGKFFYDTGMSIADFATITALTGGSGASLAIMGMSSAADTTIEAKERGLSDGKAIVLGAASGLIEAATEKIGLDKLMNIIAGGGKGVKGALKSILKQTLAEGGEEILSAVGNDALDVLISLDKSKWETEIDALMENDPSLSRNEAWGKVFGSHMLEYGLSGLGGAISGGVMGGAGVGISTLTGGFKKFDTSKIEKHEIKTPEEAKSEKKDVKYPEPYEIILDAEKAPMYSDYYKYAESVAKSGTLTSENILRLEELWEKRQHTPEAISQIEKLAGEGKTLDQVEKSVREKYDVETITYAEIEDAYNEASEVEISITEKERNIESPNSTAKYSISKDSEGKEYVSVDNDILEGKNNSDIPKILSDIVENRFNSLIEVDGQKIGINKKTAREWRMSKNAQSLLKNDSDTYQDKIKAFDNADELLKIAKDYINESPNHQRKDNFVNFARGNVRFKVGGNGYEADIVVGITKNGNANLYDVVNIKGITIAEPDNTTLAEKTSADRRGSSSANGIISQNTDFDNTFSEKNNKNATNEGVSSYESEHNESKFQEKEARDDISDGSGKRNARESSREPSGELGESTKRWKGILEGADGADEIGRARTAATLRTEHISSASLGIANGTDTPRLRIYPEEKWDDNLKNIQSVLKKETGKEVIFVQGPIEIRTKTGVRNVRGVNMDEKIIIRMNDLKVHPENIAFHELYHERAAESPGLNEAIKEAIIERFSEKEFNEVLEVYADKLAGIYEFDEHSEEEYNAVLDAILEEIFADAYANINGFGVHPEKFRKTVVKITETEHKRVQSLKRKASGEIKKKNSPKDNYSFGDVPIPTYEELIAKDDMEIVDLTNSYGKGRYKDQRTDFIKSDEAKALLSEPVLNKDTGEKIFIVNSTFTHSFSNDKLGAEQIAAVKNIRKIIENAVLTHAETPTHGNESTTGVYTLFAAVKTKTGIKPTKLKVKEYRLDGSPLSQNIIEYFEKNGILNPYSSVYDNRVLILEEDGMVTAETKKEEPSGSAVPRNSKSAVTGDHPSGSSNHEEPSSSARPSAEKTAASSYPSGSSVISIADLLALVNSEYQKYIPKKKNGSIQKYSVDDNNEIDTEGLEAVKHDSKQMQLERTFEEDSINNRKKKRPKTEPVAVSRPLDSKKKFKSDLFSIFSIPVEKRKDLGSLIDRFAEDFLKKGSITESSRDSFIDALYAEGVVTQAVENVYSEGSRIISGSKIFVDENLKGKFGEDWNIFRQRAFLAGVILTNNNEDPNVRQWNDEFSRLIPDFFSTDTTDDIKILEKIVEVAEEGKGQKMSLAEYSAMMESEGYSTSKELLDEIERKVDEAIHIFARSAKLEVKLRDRTGVKMQQQREAFNKARLKEKEKIRDKMDTKMQQQREAFNKALLKEKEKQILRDAKARQKRLEAAQRKKENQNVKEVQNETIKTLQWLMRHQNKASDEFKAKFKEVLSDIDIFAKSAADAMRWSDKYQATWQDIEQMYKDAQENDPNFLPSKEIEKIIARLNNRKVADMDMSALMDLYKAAVGLRTEYKNRKNMLLDKEQRTHEEIYKGISQEMANGGEKHDPDALEKFFNNDQLTPMNVLERMGGWNPEGALYGLGKMLEQGEYDVHSYIIRAGKILDEFLKKNKDWVRMADGQHKNSIWYTEEIHPYLGKGKYSPETVTVHMTPSMRVYLYLESKGIDNVRHMTAKGGGRTFADKELYSKGKRAEAFAQGTTVRLSPETIKQLADPAKMTEQELKLASLMEDYYKFAKTEINKTSNALHGFSRAMENYYAQIFTNKNYTKVGFDHFASPSAEGSIKERMADAENPSYCIGAFDAFERHVNTTSKYVGLSIPVHNFKVALNWREDGNSASDRITHKWGKEGLDYIHKMLEDIQSTDMSDKSTVEAFVSKLSSNYISAVFGLNPSIVFKQVGSMMTAATYLGWNNRFIPQKGRADYKKMGVKKRQVISQYTNELDYRTLGYSSEETKTLKDNPNWLDRNPVTAFLIRGDAITWLDGRVAEALWRWTENEVRRENPELELGTNEEIMSGESEFYKAVAKRFDYVVSRSQSMSDFMHQSTMRKSKNLIARMLTLFKSDAAQNYNIHRQLIGEALYLEKSGASEEAVKKAWNRVGRAVLNTLIGYSWAALINFLINLWKYKGKRYKDDEGELTAGSVAWGILEDVFSNYAGIVVLGEELAAIIPSAIKREFRYDTDAIEIEQLNELFSILENQSKLFIDICAGAINVLNGGGDVGKYFSKKSSEIIGGIRDIAKTCATYIWGLPADNLEKYLLGAVKWVSPELGAAYDDITDTVQKKDLKELSGKALEGRISRVFGTRNVDISDETAAILADLYEGEFTDAIPSATPTKFTADKVEYVLDEHKQQVFDDVWSETVNDVIDEITSSEVFKNAVPEAQEKMLNKLYTLATYKAKVQLVKDYEDGIEAIEKANDKITELKKAGLDLADFYIISGAYTYFNGNDEEYPTEKEQANAFASWANTQGYTADQVKVINDKFVYFGMYPIKTEAYNALTDAGFSDETASKAASSGITAAQSKVVVALGEAGLSDDEAIDVVESFKSIEPINGGKKASDYQKAELATKKIKDPAKQLVVLEEIMTNKQYKIMKLAYETYRIEPSLYIKVYLAAETLSYETTGDKKVNKTELKTVLDDLDLNDGKKAQLYQFITSEDVTLNPFSFEHANFVKEDMDALFA